MAMSTRNLGGKRRSTMAEINITPFTDVCLVLLIIFMVSASFLSQQRSMDVKLPAPSTDSSQDERPTRDITLEIQQNGAVQEEIATGSGSPTTRTLTIDQLLPALEKEVNDYHVQSLTLKAVHGVVYRSVIRVMDVVKQAGIDYQALAVQDTLTPAGESPAAATPGAASTPSASASGSSTSAPASPASDTSSASGSSTASSSVASSGSAAVP